MKHNLYTIFIIMFFLYAFSDTVAQGERRLIRHGNRLYEKEQFDESELSYRRALEKDNVSPHARFNLGNSLFKQERYDEAMGFYGNLAEDIADPVNRSKVYHNLGNSMLMAGQIEQSIEAYKEALRNNPGDDETRYNLAYAQNLLDEMENQQQDNDNQGEGENQDQEDQNDQGQQNEEPRDDQESQGEEGDRQQEQSQPDPEQISIEDAMRLLDAAEREEQRVQEELMEKKASESQLRTGRNW